MTKTIRKDIIINGYYRDLEDKFIISKGKKYKLISSDELFTSQDNQNNEAYINPIKDNLEKYPEGNVQLLIKSVYNTYNNLTNVTNNMTDIASNFSNANLNLNAPSGIINIDSQEDLNMATKYCPISNDVDPKEFYFFIGRREFIIKLNQEENIIESIIPGRFHDTYLSNYFLEYHFERIEDASTEKILYIKCHNFERMSFDNNYENAIISFKNWLDLNDEDVKYATNEAYFWTNKSFTPSDELKTKITKELSKYTF